MKQFEYYFSLTENRSIQTLQQEFDYIGSLGYKLVSVDAGIAYFVKEVENETI